VWSESISIEITFCSERHVMLKRILISLLAIFALSFGVVGAAGAVDDQDADCQLSTSDVVSEECEGEPIGPVEVEDNDDVVVAPKTLPPTTDVQGRQQLPVTGAESVTLALGGALLVGAGGLMVRRSAKTA
jgi:LPXTG-motif cell wall-anchored protein